MVNYEQGEEGIIALRKEKKKEVKIRITIIFY